MDLEAARKQLEARRQKIVYPANEVKHIFTPDERRELRDISEALRRIANGTYGICLNPDCREQIDERRLQVLPAAAHCISCAQEIDAPIQPRKRRPVNEGRSSATTRSY